MAIAGKVAITPKGEWNANTAYTKLDLVFYDNASYVAIQPSTGVEPTNTSYWMLVVQSAGGADLEGIINGDIQVGNAKTLDGHEAEYFAPYEKVVSGVVLSSNILEYALTLENGNHFVRLSGNAHDGSGLPHNNYRFGCAQIEKRSASNIMVMLWGIAQDYPPQINYYNGASWSGWQTIATLTDLANYLPKTGGYITGAEAGIGSGSSESGYTWGLRNSKRFITEQVLADGTYRVRDTNNSKNIINSTVDGTNTFNGAASGNLPINGGGTVRKEGDTPLVVENTKAGYSYTYIGYKNANDINYMGFNNGKPYVYGQGDILHTGNKPTGTYTGNGDATSRTISTGGIGNVLYVWSENGNAVIMPTGGFVSSPSSGVTRLPSNEARFANGVLTLSTTNAVINANGTVTEYQVA